jgi:hypothetical protein
MEFITGGIGKSAAKNIVELFKNQKLPAVRTKCLCRIKFASESIAKTVAIATIVFASRKM